MGTFEDWLAREAEIEGWFSRPAAAVWDALLVHQRELRVRGDLLEIGVWKGKSALLAALHTRADESLVLVDMLPLDAACALIEPVKPVGVHYVRANSADLLAKRILDGGQRGVRFIHIDGEHTGWALHADLDLANQLLSDDGLLVLDDFMSPMYPQLTMAAFRWLERHPAELTLFLCGFNKGYLCRPRAAGRYLRFVRERLHAELAERGVAATLAKTTEPADMNCFGLVAAQPGLAYRGPDWAPETIQV